MSDILPQEKKPSGFPDFFVVLFCLCGAAASLYMFQSDLFSTLRSFLNLPAGTVTVKYNTVQRRFKDRMIWDRLFEESPVYNGDLVRVARLSGAVINIDNNNIELGENTLIRISKDDGPANIDFYSGEVNITSFQNSDTILLSIGDKVVQAPAGTAFGASSGENGIVLRITEGTARVISGGQSSLAPAGTVIIQDAQGREILEKSAVVTLPRPNARYLKTGDNPFGVKFEWLKVNMGAQDKIRLEIAEDRNFARMKLSLDNLDTSATAALDAGLWHWRLSCEGDVLAAGRVTVTQAAAPSLFDAVVTGPDVQLRWLDVEQASGYLLQVSEFPEFNNPVISTQVQGTSYIMHDPGNGTWHWRVRPFYSSVYEGTANFSQVSSFQIEEGAGLLPVSLNIPAQDSIIISDRDEIYFSWSNSRDAVSYTVQISSRSDLRNPVISRTVNNNFFVYGKDESPLVPDRYYWSVFYIGTRGNLSPLAQIRSFLITEEEIAQRLISPPDLYNVEEEALSSVRFSWDTNLLSDRRFQVSASENFSTLAADVPVNENSYQGLSLPSGEWYWRLSARRSSMSQAVSASPRRFTVTAALVTAEAEPQPATEEPTEPQQSGRPHSELPVQEAASRVQEPAPPPRPQPLPAPGNRRPAGGIQIGAEDLRRQRNIAFSWNAVEGATSYVLSIYRVTASGRRQIFRTEPLSRPGFTLENLRIFDSNGTYAWQVEALSYNRQGVIERSGRPGENTFTINVPRPGRVQVGDTGVMYGN